MPSLRELKDIAAQLIKSGKVDMVLGYTEVGPLQTVPYVAKGEEDVEKLTFDYFSYNSLVKYLLEDMFQGKRTAVVVKACDQRALSLMLQENRVARENLYLIGVQCPGLISKAKLLDFIKAPLDGVALDFKDQLLICDETQVPVAQILAPYCLACQGDGDLELDAMLTQEATPGIGCADRFQGVSSFEKLNPQERFQFWQDQLSKCKRCYACRNACPVCTCRVCLFDREAPDYLDKANTLAQNLSYHILRAFHISDRCVGCGECSRVCPEQIPLHLLGLKLIQELEKFYGAYTPGKDPLPAPLSVAKVQDPDPFKGVK